MRVRMLYHISGGRGDGSPWPPAGGELITDEDEATQLCRAGLAVPIPDDPVETAVPAAADTETRAATPKRSTRAKSSPVSPAPDSPRE